MKDRESARDQWQRPGEVLDKLGVNPGTRVADIGAGEGYFTWHLAARVGPQGRAIAVDLNDASLGRIRDRAADAGLSQVETVRSERNDPKLAAGSLDAVLIVNAYHEFKEHDAMLKGIALALRPGGRLGILDYASAIGRPRVEYTHEIPGELVVEDAARHGLRLKYFEDAFIVRPRGPRGYIAIFERPANVEAVHQH